MYYRTCPNCGAHLDPGERCDCEDELRTSFKSLTARDIAEGGIFALSLILTAAGIGLLSCL